MNIQVVTLYFFSSPEPKGLRTPDSTQGRIQGGAKIGQWGFPSQKDFFFRFEGYSNKLEYMTVI